MEPIAGRVEGICRSKQTQLLPKRYIHAHAETGACVGKSSETMRDYAELIKYVNIVREFARRDEEIYIVSSNTRPKSASGNLHWMFICHLCVGEPDGPCATPTCCLMYIRRNNGMFNAQVTINDTCSTKCCNPRKISALALARARRRFTTNEVS
jgi:hypothetical protein